MSEPAGAVPPPPQPPPPPPPPPPYVPPSSGQAVPPSTAVGDARRPRKPRHGVWALVALLATPVGIWWSVEGGLGVNEEASFDGDGGLDPIYLIFMLIGLVLLAVVAASGGSSAAGPLVAAVVWGVAPVLVHSLAPDLFTRIGEEFDEVVADWFDEYALVIFPLVTALMLGALVAGRRGRTA